jgi:hypothetical protein
MKPRALPPGLHAANDALAFLLEVAALAALGWWGATRGNGTAAAVLLGVGAPLAAGVAWGLFAAPKAKVRLPMAGVLAVKALVFASAAAAIWAIGRPLVASAFAAVALANAVVAAFDRDALVRAARARS